MPDDDASPTPIALGHLSERVLDGFLPGVPEPMRTVMLRQVREDLNALLCLEPATADPAGATNTWKSLTSGIGSANDNA